MQPNFNKVGGLLPAIIQNANTGQVLMLGYMNEEAYDRTSELGKVVFFSRSKNRLWMKGEQSGNTLQLVSMDLDCDQDALLVQVLPAGPTCHTGSKSCFNQGDTKGFLYELESTIAQRAGDQSGTSYTKSLLDRGTAKVAQKVGEEAVEVVIEGMRGDRDRLISESADLLYHLLVLFQDQGLNLSQIEAELLRRSSNS